MKFTLTKTALQKALRVVSGVVEKKSNANAVLSSVFFSVSKESLDIVATDNEIELTATVPVTSIDKEGSSLIPCRKINDVCRVLPDAVEVVVESVTNKVAIKAGRSRFSLSALTSGQFPSTNEFAPTQTLPMARLELKKLLEKVVFAMAEDDVRQFLNGVLLEVGSDFVRVVAADGHRLALQTLTLPTQTLTPQKIIIPRKGVLEILRVLGESDADLISVVLGVAHLKIVCADLSITTVLLGSKYPDYERVVPQNGDKTVLANKEQLKGAVYRVAALLHEKFKGVRLKFSDNNVKIMAYNTEKDEAEEDLAISFVGPEIELGFNARYLLEYFAAVETNTITMTFSDPNGSVLLMGEGEKAGLCVLMPMRV